MAYWKDNADSYICSVCGYECNNPKKLPKGSSECPKCKSKMEITTNADRISAMTIEEKARFLSEITYAGKTPWSDPFYEQNCKNCPTTECFMEGRTEPMQLYECDFTDGVCPHGDEIMWWLNQPSEVQINENHM